MKSSQVSDSAGAQSGLHRPPERALWFAGYTKLQGTICLIITFYLCYNCERACCACFDCSAARVLPPPQKLPASIADIRYVPFRTAWVNALQASFFASLSWASLVIVLNAYLYPKQTVQIFTILLWAGELGMLPKP